MRMCAKCRKQKATVKHLPEWLCRNCLDKWVAHFQKTFFNKEFVPRNEWNTLWDKWLSNRKEKVVFT